MGTSTEKNPHAMLGTQSLFLAWAMFHMLEDLQGAQGAGEDTFTEIGEESWYNPELDLPAINAYLESWSGQGQLFPLSGGCAALLPLRKN